MSDAQRERDDEALKAKQDTKSSLQIRLEEQEKRIAADLEAERAKAQTDGAAKGNAGAGMDYSGLHP